MLKQAAHTNCNDEEGAMHAEGATEGEMCLLSSEHQAFSVQALTFEVPPSKLNGKRNTFISSANCLVNSFK